MFNESIIFDITLTLLELEPPVLFGPVPIIKSFVATFNCFETLIIVDLSFIKIVTELVVIL